jgi:hypothetical protein
MMLSTPLSKRFHRLKAVKTAVTTVERNKTDIELTRRFHVGPVANSSHEAETAERESRHARNPKRLTPIWQEDRR